MDAVFVQRLGIPATMLGFNDGDYPVYHSVFDNYQWMAEQGDPGFHRHVAVTQVWGAVALTLAEAPDLPLDFVNYAAVLQGYVKDVRHRLVRAGGRDRVDLAPMVDGLARLEAAATQVERERRRFLDEGSSSTVLSTVRRSLRTGGRQVEEEEQEGVFVASALAHFVRLREFNDRLMLAERGFLDFEGLNGPGELPFRAWLRHEVYSPPQGNEYGSAAFAGVVDAIGFAEDEEEGWANVQRQVWRAGRALDRAAMALRGRLL